MYSTRPLSELLHDGINKNLIFIHTPKCGGTYVSRILSHLGIKCKGHNQATPNEGIAFTVIRDPIERFESLLNYRLDESQPRNDWPKHLSYVYHDKNIQLNEIFSKMTDNEILGFSPYRTINYYTKDVDIIITLENLSKLLEYFGYTYDKNLFKPVKVSNKIRGKLNQENKDRIKLLFNDDVLLYNMVVNSVL
jgi:hypothetical protein